MTQISGKSAVVTGGGSGIGRGLAMELARQGASVAIADINPDNASKVAADITAMGHRAVAIPTDVCDRASVRALAQEAAHHLGPIQLLFANAGATSFDPLADMSEDDIEWIVEVNLMGVMRCTRAFLPAMIAANTNGLGGSHICATSSMAGLLPAWIPDHAPYSAAKAGIIGLMLNLGLELAPHNIHTTAYCPGGVASGMKAHNATYRPARFGGPQAGEVEIAHDDAQLSTLAFYTPDAIAPIVLNAVKNNRPFVFDHANQRQLFFETYAKIVDSCYDDIAQWEAENGLPAINPTGAMLIG